MRVSRKIVEARLMEGGIKYAVLELDSGYRALVTERWGRILGPFDPEEGHSFLWLNPLVWGTAESFTSALTEGAWNVGGERVWIAPEIRINIKDRSAFWDTYELPREIDPGNWELSFRGSAVSLSQKLSLRLYNPPSGELHLKIERSVVSVPNPLRHLSIFHQLIEGVSYAGYRHDVILSMINSQQGDAQCEAWTICQLEPPGTILVPCTPGVEYVDYFEPADSSCVRFYPEAAKLFITGNRRYKVGLRSPHLLGRAAYLHRSSPVSELVVRTYFNDPTSEYVEEPGPLTGCRGLSFHVYNDGGLFGGFGELECNGRTLGVSIGRTVSRDEFGFWYFRGPKKRLLDIGRIFLGDAVYKI